MRQNDFQLVLFGTEHCHLCEQAQDVLAGCGLADDYSLIDISTDDRLMELYGLRIPVLAADARELDWPFDHHAVQDFLASAGEQY
ncbi:glutaredoxin family protein [Methylonatrum kenyense]|uniref:glutaredoxin family protein n=1 Tax=Methylonatrum kenyense TaxID=455253 RepID=UPI0020BFB9CE|nr:glutaredoxin family protein [Methylonatrum kenyense]MCK8516431.1 glutaredoxin family protein [Methylonatrum kenyense]